MSSQSDVRIDIGGRVTQAVESAVNELGEVGVQVAAYLDGELIVDTWAGLADERSGELVTRDTVFNIFSITKAITATAVHILAERGFIDYDAPVSRYWPEFAAGGKADALVVHALSHRIGLPAMPDGVTVERMIDYSAMVDAIAVMRPMFPFGSKSPYHAYTFGWIVGELVRRADPEGRRIDQFIAEEICESLGIESLWLGIQTAVEPRLAALRDDIKRPALSVDPATLTGAERVRLAAIPAALRTTPENFMRSDVRAACLPGMGAIGDARSVARFFAMLAGGGELGGVRLLSAERVSWCCTRPEPVPDDEHDLDDKVISRGGFHLPVPDHGQASYYHAVGGGPRLLTHAGSGGQLAWADLDKRFAAAILHNRMFSPHADRSADPLVVIGDALRAAADLI